MMKVLDVINIVLGSIAALLSFICFILDLNGLHSISVILKVIILFITVYLVVDCILRS